MTADLMSSPVDCFQEGAVVSEHKYVNAGVPGIICKKGRGRFMLLCISRALGTRW